MGTIKVNVRFWLRPRRWLPVAVASFTVEDRRNWMIMAALPVWLPAVKWSVFGRRIEIKTGTLDELSTG